MWPTLHTVPFFFHSFVQSSYTWTNQHTVTPQMVLLYEQKSFCTPKATKVRITEGQGFFESCRNPSTTLILIFKVTPSGSKNEKWQEMLKIMRAELQCANKSACCVNHECAACSFLVTDSPDSLVEQRIRLFQLTRPDDGLSGGLSHSLRKKRRGLPFFDKF